MRNIFKLSFCILLVIFMFVCDNLIELDGLLDNLNVVMVDKVEFDLVYN